MEQREERTVPANDPARRRNDARVRSPARTPSQGPPQGRRRMGRRRSRHHHQVRPTGAPTLARSEPRAHRPTDRTSPTHVPRPAAHRGHAHGAGSERSRRAPGHRRPARAQPRDADEHLRPRAPEVTICGGRPHRPAKRRPDAGRGAGAPHGSCGSRRILRPTRAGLGNLGAPIISSRARSGHRSAHGRRPGGRHAVRSPRSCAGPHRARS